MSNYGAFSPEVLADGLSEEQLEAIETEFNEALVREAEGDHRYPGSTFEGGVKAALAWVLGETDDPPLTESADEDYIFADDKKVQRKKKS